MMLTALAWLFIGFWVAVGFFRFVGTKKSDIDGINIFFFCLFLVGWPPVAFVWLGIILLESIGKCVGPYAIKAFTWTVGRFLRD